MGRTIEKIENAFKAITSGLRTLHGRHIYDMYSLYLEQLRIDLKNLIQKKIISYELDPIKIDTLIVLPNYMEFSPKRLRCMWDYFIFIYMSHKVQNIKRKQFGKDYHNLVFLRGFDYEFTVSKRGKAISSKTTSDMMFQISIIHKLKNRFNIQKNLSPTDLGWIMPDIGPYLISKGNPLHAVAEFARIRDEGFFLNQKNWKKSVVNLFPSASAFLVYVSYRSNGLKFELESLLRNKLETNTVLVLDSNRTVAQQKFCDVQDDLISKGNSLLISLTRDACSVDDPEGFEHLLKRFPFKIQMNLNKEKLYDNILSLVELVHRQPEDQPPEIPFEYGLHLDSDEKLEVKEFHKLVSRQIDKCLSEYHISNWSALKLFIEFDIFLNLIFGKICEAAVSTAKYAALADFSAEYLKLNALDFFNKVGESIEKHGNTAMNIALDALSCGEWNDYSNRLKISRELVDQIVRETNSILFKSMNSCSGSVIPMSKIQDEKNNNEYVDLLKQVLDSQIIVDLKTKHGEDL